MQVLSSPFMTLIHRQTLSSPEQGCIGRLEGLIAADVVGAGPTTGEVKH